MSEQREMIWEKDDHHVVPPAISSVVTFVVLAVLVVVQLMVGFSDLGPWKVLANLVVAGVQAAILSLFFMDLKSADKLTWLCVGAAMFWTGLLFLFTLTDYLTRHLAAY